MKLVLVAFFSCLVAFPSYSQNLDAEAQLIERILIIKNQITEKNPPNSFQVQLPVLDSPAKVLSKVGQVQALLTNARSENLRLPLQAQLAVLEALKLLYRGRGNTERGDSRGWFPLSQSLPTGSEEIRAILSMRLLDETGLAEFSAFIEAYDFNHPGNKKSAGFPTQFETHTDAHKTAIKTLVAQAQPAAAYTANAGHPRQLTLAELISQAQEAGRILADRETKKAIAKLAAETDENIYDKSVETLNKPQPDFTDFFGRQGELQRLSDIFTKLEKQHVLMTGKAGVGKTTIMEMLSDKAVQGLFSIRNEPPPICLMLSITTVTNANDPTQIRDLIKTVIMLSQKLNRRFVIGVDEAQVSTKLTRNAIKGFLTKLGEPIEEGMKVHLAFLTTGDESRTFLDDSAFSRRWDELFVDEFDKASTIQLIKQSKLPKWRVHHRKSNYIFDSVSEDAYELAYRYGGMEQPHAGNPTGTKELLEGAITMKLNQGAAAGQSGTFTLAADDVRNYLKTKFKLDLIAGDPEFEEKFREKWSEFRAKYPGNDGAMLEVEAMMKNHFGNFMREQMSTAVAFGPPSAGKTYLCKTLADVFFHGALLTLNGGELSNRTAVEKMIGSAPGYVGSEEQRSRLTKFIRENPRGGIIAFEEADFAHADAFRLLANIITDMNFADGLGQTFRTENYLIIATSNIGQDHMLSPGSENEMDWNQYNLRRQNLTEKVQLGDREVEIVRREKMNSIFDQFLGAIVTGSSPQDDTALVSQDAEKQKRRWKRKLYLLPPNKEELFAAGKVKVAEYQQRLKTEYGIELLIDESTIREILRLDHYEFAKGFTYVHEQLEDRLFQFINFHLHNRGKTLQVSCENSRALLLNGEEVPGQNLVVHIDNEELRFDLGAKDNIAKNPWGDSPEMLDRIRKFAINVHENAKDSFEVNYKVQELLKLKASDWNTRVVVTLVGPTGNGKTNYGYAVAQALFGDKNACMPMEGLTDKYKLAQYLRPPAGTIESNKQTQFESWVKSRVNAGGGVIILDELLSFAGLNGLEISARLEAFNELYSFLDRGKLRIGNTLYDLSGFVVIVTGNALQEIFQNLGDTPDSEQIAQKLVAKFGRDKIVEYFSRMGLDPPKVVRLGEVFIIPPVKRETAVDISRMKIREIIKTLQSRSRRNLEIVIEDRVVDEIVARLRTNLLGMRDVDREGIIKIIKAPLSGIAIDIPELRKIELKCNDEGRLTWYGNDRQLVYEARVQIPRAPEFRAWNYQDEAATESADRTPQFADLNMPHRVILSEEAFESVLTHEYEGHWTAELLLNGKNTAEAISLISDDSFLGFVRQKESPITELTSLTSIIQQMIMLNSGHRAEFLAGRFAVGGGNNGGPRDQNVIARDDLGKIDQLFRMGTNNRIFPVLHEESSKEEKHFVREFLTAVVDLMSDELITIGKTSGQFAAGRELLKQEKFLASDELDRLATEIDFSQFGESREVFFMRLFHDSVLKITGNYTRTENKEDNFKRNFAGELLDRVFAELRVKSPADRALRGFINQSHEHVTRKTGVSCKWLLAQNGGT
jgi:ATP-dependent Clp protease ATP-binding subunit ClpA